jgi:hypothetical protein
MQLRPFAEGNLHQIGLAKSRPATSQTKNKAVSALTEAAFSLIRTDGVAAICPRRHVQRNDADLSVKRHRRLSVPCKLTTLYAIILLSMQYIRLM